MNYGHNDPREGDWIELTNATTEVEEERCSVAVEIAREVYAAPSDDDVEVDDHPVANLAGDPSEPLEERGVWVQAWLYVHPEEIQRVLARRMRSRRRDDGQLEEE